MQGANKPSVKYVKSAEKEAFVKTERYNKAVFKAIPIPQGGWKTNDNYSLTQSSIVKTPPTHNR